MEYIMATKILKMRSGEEIISNITEKFAGEKVVAYTMRNPCMLIPMPNKGGGASIAIVPWMASVKQAQGFDVPVDAVLFTGDPMDELGNEYNEAFGSGLIVPNKMVASSLKLSI